MHPSLPPRDPAPGGGSLRAPPPITWDTSTLDLAAAARHQVSAVLQELGSTQTGLTSDQAANRLATVGRNVLAPTR
jgi:Cation transporter/ATPase, N-terminus